MSSSISTNHLCNLTLLGNLVSTPIIRYQANPVVAVAELVLATHSKWFDKTSKKHKEWTSYHTVKVIGDIVEGSLIHAQKGDIILIQGYLINSKKAGREIIHATYAQTFPKGYSPSINQIHCSGQIVDDVKLITTEHNKELADILMTINHTVYSSITQQNHQHQITRSLHVWGKQAQYLAEHAKAGDQLIIDGKLNYLHNQQKSQLVDAQQVILLKQTKSV